MSRQPTLRRFVRMLCCAGAMLLAASPAQSQQFSCGDVTAPVSITASDALFVLRTAVSLQQCSRCACDIDGSGSISASDALFTLKAAVGQDVPLRCPFCCDQCACTPQRLTVTLGEVAPCEGCIPRIPASFAVPDGVTVTFAPGLNDTYELAAVAECEWEATFPGVFAEKVIYGAGDTVCSGGIVSEATDGGIVFRVVRTGVGWDTYVGQYAAAYSWGDVATASVESATCDIGNAAASQNEICHLAELDNAADYDVHAIGGTVSVDVAGQAVVCP